MKRFEIDNLSHEQQLEMMRGVGRCLRELAKSPNAERYRNCLTEEDAKIMAIFIEMISKEATDMMNVRREAGRNCYNETNSR